MPSYIRSVTFDCADPYALARFWAEAVGGEVHPDGVPGGDEAFVAGADGRPELLFLRVPEGKSAKNRVHLDLGPRGTRRDEEMRRLVGLGATVLQDLRREGGAGFWLMADPEGNEFCIEISDEEIPEVTGREA